MAAASQTIHRTPAARHHQRHPAGTLVALLFSLCLTRDIASLVKRVVRTSWLPPRHPFARASSGWAGRAHGLHQPGCRHSCASW